MSIVVFCGPSLGSEEVRAILPAADVRPPAARGDLLAAALRGPSAIGLIDGYFSRVPAVWHKEILWAMAKGVHVFGAASMGALRAAELARFGMEGVGTVFEWFRTGTLTDDDEVAVVHAPAEGRYRPLSEAMVNVRATAAAAIAAGVIRAAAAAAIVSAAKRLSYAERTYENLVAAARAAPDLAGEIDAFDRWRRQGRVDQKRADAIAMLERMAERSRAGWTPKAVDYAFSHTDAWEALHGIVAARASADALAHGSRGDLLKDELLANGGAAEALAGGLLRALCLTLSRRTGVTRIDPRAVEAVIEDFRRERSLLRPADFDAWLKAQRMAEPDLVPFFEREALVRAGALASEGDVTPHVADHLRARGDLGPLLARAEEKQVQLAARGLASPELSDTGLDERGLWRWYFVERLGRPVPLDLESHARSLHTDLHRLRQAVVREYLFSARSV